VLAISSHSPPFLPPSIQRFTHLDLSRLRSGLLEVNNSCPQWDLNSRLQDPLCSVLSSNRYSTALPKYIENCIYHSRSVHNLAHPVDVSIIKFCPAVNLVPIIYTRTKRTHTCLILFQFRLARYSSSAACPESHMLGG